MPATSVQVDSQIPRVSGVIERPQLLAKLAAASDHKLTLVCAPPGYGKTTLVAQFASQTSLPVAWHAVEERERDVPNLYNQCLAALSPVVPGIESLTPMPGYTPGELASLIADHLRENLTRKIVYVLDDVHLLTGSPAAELWLHHFVSRLPSNCHLILISRVLPNLPLTEMIARGEVVALGQEQLRFTTDEIGYIAHDAPGDLAAKTDLEDLALRLEGWPAGVVLAIYPLPADLERAMLNGGQGPEALFNALASSMLDMQPLGLVDFLLASSTLARITPELCLSVLQLPDSAYWLSEAQNRNLFLTRIAGGMVYHRLFRDFLQDRIKTQNPTRFMALHARAGQWFEENNRLDDSFDHYMAAGLVERSAAIAERVSQAYFAQGKVETLLRWSARITDASVFAPNLLYNCARIYTDRYHYAEAELALDDAESGYRSGKNKLGIANVQIQRAMIKLQQGNYQVAVRHATQLAARHNTAPNLRGRALKILGVGLMRLGDVEEAIATLEDAVYLHREDGDAYALANVLQDLGVAYSRSGRFEDASACLQEVVALRRLLGSAGALALALNNLGYYYQRGSDYRLAMTTFQEGLSVVARVPNRRAESYLLWSLGDLQRDRGAFDEAWRFYNKALELIGTSEPSLRCAILVNASTLQRWQGDYQAALALAEDAWDLAREHRIALESITAEAALWAAKAQRGEPVLDHLESVVTDLLQMGARFELVWAFGLCAEAALCAGQERIAEQHLLSGIQLAKTVGSAQPLVAEIVHTPLLEVHVINEGARYASLARELSCLREAQVTTTFRPKSKEQTVTYSLRVWTLGQEQIERDGKLIAASEWRANSAREMFLYLLFQGPKSREQISLEFWPDSSTKRVRSNFHTTLYRARQALGDNVITFQDGLYLINPDLDLWCDAQELDILAQQARLLPLRDARTEDLWNKAAQLFQGDFLTSLDTEWVIYRRERLVEVYLEALVGAGECARARNNVREALAIFRRVLTVDPYREDVHRAIMSCYAALGERKQILSHMQKLQELLWDELGIEPSGETVDLASALLG